MGREFVVILIYIDDILVTGLHIKLVEKVILQLGLECALKYLGELNYFFGLEVTPSHEGLHLS